MPRDAANLEKTEMSEPTVEGEIREYIRGVQDERKRVVAWLRETGANVPAYDPTPRTAKLLKVLECADAIERGEHER